MRVQALPTQPPKASSAPVQADCDPPFELDDKGHKRYKRGCFQ